MNPQQTRSVIFMVSVAVFSMALGSKFGAEYGWMCLGGAMALSTYILIYRGFK